MDVLQSGTLYVCVFCNLFGWQTFTKTFISVCLKNTIFLGVAKDGHECIYIVSLKDSIQPICVSFAEVRKWNTLVFDYLIRQIEWAGFDDAIAVTTADFLHENFDTGDQIPQIICKCCVFFVSFNSLCFVNIFNTHFC